MHLTLLSRMALVFLIGPAIADAAAQSSGTPAQAEPMHIHLRCDALTSSKQRHAIETDAFGFGNPTSPEAGQNSFGRSRRVHVELDGNTGRIELPPEFSGSSDLPAVEEGTDGRWYSVSNLRVLPGDVTFDFSARTPGAQHVKINRLSGLAELTGYGAQPLRATCHVESDSHVF